MSKVIYANRGKRIHLICKGPDGRPFIGDKATAYCGTEYEISTFDNFENLPYCIGCNNYSWEAFGMMLDEWRSPPEQPEILDSSHSDCPVCSPVKMLTCTRCGRTRLEKYITLKKTYSGARKYRCRARSVCASIARGNRKGAK